MDALLLYDGQCAMCAHAVRFLAPRDAKGRIRYAAIAGPHGRARAVAAGVDPGAPSTMLLFVGANVYRKSDAVLRALRLIRAPGIPYFWPALGWAGRLIPRRWRDALYDWVADNRYHWFGRACLAPDPAWADRVLD